MQKISIAILADFDILKEVLFCLCKQKIRNDINYANMDMFLHKLFFTQIRNISDVKEIW